MPDQVRARTAATNAAFRVANSRIRFSASSAVSLTRCGRVGGEFLSRFVFTVTHLFERFALTGSRRRGA
jgi:hypothetical protein